MDLSDTFRQMEKKQNKKNFRRSLFKLFKLWICLYVFDFIPPQTTTSISPKHLIALWCSLHMCTLMLACGLLHMHRAAETLATLIAAALPGCSGKFVDLLLCCAPKEELQESSFVSSSSTYFTCLYSGRESLCCWLFTSAVFVCFFSC